jgi:hypothetical protein
MISPNELFTFLAIGVACAAMGFLGFRVGYSSGYRDGFRKGVRKAAGFASLKSHERQDSSTERYYGG